MVDRQFGLSRPQSEPPAPLPSICEARVDLQRPLYQGYGSVDVLTEVTKGIRGPAESNSVVATLAKSLSGTIDAFSAICLGVIGPATDVQRCAAHRCERKAWAIMRVPLDRPSEQIEG